MPGTPWPSRRPALLGRPSFLGPPSTVARAALRRPGLRRQPRTRRAVAGPLASGLQLAAGVAALAAGGVAAGLELERRIVSRRLFPDREPDAEPVVPLRSAGPVVTTPDGVDLHTEVDELPAGQSPDLTVVFVHGYALNMDCWHFQRRHFRGRVRQVFYDQRSHGRSGRSDPARCRVPQLAEDLAQVITELVGSGPLILVGHSMGGMTIMQLAQDHPELFDTQICGVALFSTAAGQLGDHSPIAGMPGRAFSRVAEPLMAALNRVPVLVEHGRRAGTDLAYVVTRRMSFGSPVPARYVGFMSDMLADTSLQVVADFYPGFAEVDLFTTLATLSRVECLVIGGEDDVVTPIAYTDRILELLPGAEGARLASCGHMGIIEHADVFNTALEALMERACRNQRARDDLGGQQEPAASRR